MTHRDSTKRYFVKIIDNEVFAFEGIGSMGVVRLLKRRDV